MPDQPPNPPSDDTTPSRDSDASAESVGASAESNGAIDARLRLKSDARIDAARLPEPRLSEEARAELKRAFRRELSVTPQVKIRVIADAATAFEHRKRRARSVMRTQRIAAAVLFLMGTAIAFRYMSPRNTGPLSAQQINESAKAKREAETLAFKSDEFAKVGADAATLGSRTAGASAGEAEQTSTLSASAMMDADAAAGETLAHKDTASPASSMPGEPAAAKPGAAPASMPAASPARASSPSVAPRDEKQAAPVAGDFDGSGAADVLDAFALARFLEPRSGRVKASDAPVVAAGFSGADLNADGVIDDRDVERLLVDATRVVAPVAQEAKTRAEPGEQREPAAPESAEPTASSVAGVPLSFDVVLDPRDQPLAAYQVEIKADAAPGMLTFAGVEGGEHAAFETPPRVDANAINASQQPASRLIIAAFDVGSELPARKTRVARVRVRWMGPANQRPTLAARVIAAASVGGKPIDAGVTLAPSPVR